MVLVLSNLSLALPAYAATTTLNPTAVGPAGANSWTGSPVNTDAGKVSAVQTHDSDTSYISETANGSRQTFVFPGAGVPGGSTINSVTLYVVAKGMDAGNSDKKIVLTARNGAGTFSNGGDIVTNAGYTLHNRIMTTNPFTATAWTLAEVNAWTTTFGVARSNANGTVRVTQVYIVVDYSVIVPPQVENTSPLCSDQLDNDNDQLIDLADPDCEAFIPAPDTFSISGVKFNDEDESGTQNGEEEGISGITIFIDANANGELDINEIFTATGEDGSYSFTGLLAGTYTVTEVIPGGWEQILPGGETESYTVDLTVGSQDEIDFGNHQLPVISGCGLLDGGCSITGIKYNDITGDGIDEGDLPLGGVTIYIDLDNSNGLDLGEPTDVTDLDGSFSFMGLGNGTYTVREVVPSGWIQTAPISGEFVINLNGNHSTGNLFSNHEDDSEPNVCGTDGIISGNWFHDLDSDNEQDLNETGTNNWFVYLDLDHDNAFTEGEPIVETDSEGNYTFTDLLDGTYEVRLILKDGWSITSPSEELDHEYSITLNDCPEIIPDICIIIQMPGCPGFEMGPLGVVAFGFSPIQAQGVSGNIATAINFALRFVGGGSGGNSGGGGTPPPTNPTPPATTPTPPATPGNVLGDQISDPGTGGQVLGEQLPVTGGPVALLALLGAIGLWVGTKKKN